MQTAGLVDALVVELTKGAVRPDATRARVRGRLVLARRVARAHVVPTEVKRLALLPWLKGDVRIYCLSYSKWSEMLWCQYTPEEILQTRNLDLPEIRPSTV